MVLKNNTLYFNKYWEQVKFVWGKGCYTPPLWRFKMADFNPKQVSNIER